MRAIITSAVARHEPGAHCAICGVGLSGIRRVCGRCETPYHTDCWTYNGGCAIYGCAPAKLRHSSKLETTGRVFDRPTSPQDPFSGAVFGALLGVLVLAGVTGSFHAMSGSTSGSYLKDALPWISCAATLGMFTGATVRGPSDTSRITTCGLLGPGLTAWGLLCLCGLVQRTPGPAAIATALFLLPFVLVCSLITVPLSWPCAYIASAFNDPERSHTSRILWLATVAALVVAELTALQIR